MGEREGKGERGREGKREGGRERERVGERERERGGEERRDIMAKKPRCFKCTVGEPLSLPLFTHPQCHMYTHIQT
ncbi:MAG: hypothetical protein MJE68_32470 [Proteobacteria bacterium]|nr:hypothetical protein [Pseudomonadota bacterium]